MQRRKIRVAGACAIAFAVALGVATGSSQAIAPPWSGIAQAAGSQITSATSNDDEINTQASSAADASAASDEGSGILPTWSTDLDCASCHGDEQESTTKERCLASKHADVPCTTCHNEGDKLEQIHADAAGKEPPKKLEQTEVSDATCLACHGSYEELTEKTKGSDTLEDKNGTIVNPHAVPSNETHDENISCVTCHSVHGNRAAAKLAPTLCKGCHHENVYECGTCHGLD